MHRGKLEIDVTGYYVKRLDSLLLFPNSGIVIQECGTLGVENWGGIREAMSNRFRSDTYHQTSSTFN